MSWSLMVLGAAIGANNLAVSLALGALGQRQRTLRIVAVFGLFEFTVPLIGIALGRELAERFLAIPGWLAPSLLIGMGAWAVVSALRREVDAEALARRAASWTGVMLLAASLSGDNLLIGLSLGLGQYAPLTLAAVIAGFSMSFSWFGLRVGSVLRAAHRRLANVGAGLLLLAAGAALAGGLL
ncbi:MAG: manganese efflux pump MntP family protein [Paracoccaceae bacterium]